MQRVKKIIHFHTFNKQDGGDNDGGYPRPRKYLEDGGFNAILYVLTIKDFLPVLSL